MIKSITKYISNVRGELTKVEWPKFSEVVKLTLMVIIISAVVGIFVGGLDLGLTKLLELYLKNK